MKNEQEVEELASLLQKYDTREPSECAREMIKRGYRLPEPENKECEHEWSRLRDGVDAFGPYIIYKCIKCPQEKEDRSSSYKPAQETSEFNESLYHQIINQISYYFVVSELLDRQIKAICSKFGTKLQQRTKGEK